MTQTLSRDKDADVKTNNPERIKQLKRPKMRPPSVPVAFLKIEDFFSKAFPF
jgi:hypothetical protein